jgi:hypothetical protein
MYGSVWAGIKGWEPLAAVMTYLLEQETNSCVLLLCEEEDAQELGNRNRPAKLGI